MTTTTMHFGPEWMRAKSQTLARPQAPPSPPPPAANAQQTNASTYSALVAPAAPEPEKRDEFRPFRYSKEDMLRIYKEGGGRGGLGLEVERWEGIVHEVCNEPTGLREMGDTEKKLFAGPLNSELRRRQSSDLMNTLSSPSDRPRLNHPNTGGGTPLRGFGLMGRRRDSIDQTPLAVPRKLSVSNIQGNSPTTTRDATLHSPRTRIGGFASGFDGVLNGGDSWMARRRTSESMLKVGASSGTLHEGREEDVKGPNIKEVEDTGVAQDNTFQFDSSGTSQQSPPIPDALPPDTASDSPNQRSVLGTDSVAGRIAELGLDEKERTNTNFHPNSVTDTPMTGPPPGLDPASIEWSYLDPQGQVQGPFKADVMQKWYDEGYFTPDLLMKRTHIDRDWTAVGILDRQAVGGQIFLSQFPISTGPPGLSIRTESSLQNHSPAHSTFSGYQPAPTRTLRTMTLNSYLNSASPSDSPSSSFGGGRFGNGSPESSALGSRVGDLYTGDSGLGPRAFTGNPGPFVDPVGDPRSSFGNVAPGRASSLDTFNTYNNNSHSPWPLSVTQNVQNFGSSEHPLTTGFNVMSAPVPIAQSHSFTQEPSYVDPTYNAMGSLGTSHDSPITRHPIEANGRGFNNLINSTSGSPYTPHYPQSPVVPQQRSSTSPFGEVLVTVSESPDVRTLASAVQSENLSSPWRAPESTSVRCPVIEIPVPSPIAQAPPAAWSQPAQPVRPTPKPNEPSPWLKASLGVVDDGWRELPGPNSLTVSNLGQHNKMYEEADDDGTVAVSPIGEEEEEIILAAAPEPVTVKPVPSAPATVTATPIIDPPVSTTPKTKVKPTVRELQVPAPVSAPKPAPPAPASSAPAVTSSSPVPKAAWATEDDVKKGKSSLSLREIQEAEAKKAEARKVTERERLARVNTLPPPAVIDDAQPYTASWGLPTSQTGARAVMSPRGGEVVGTPAASAPVWTTGSTAPAKKTMKEIQEEEERRKKMAVKETVAAAAARRGYAETTFKAAPSAQASGGAWSTVGANGKTGAPVSAPIRPAVTSSVSTQATVTSRPNGTTVRPVVQTTTKAVPPPRVDEAPVVPVQDFLKWLNDALKGLNHSVNLEDITQMLLTFPLDPDPSTTEIISDLIYANSTTLDGRRFAAEFVKRRRASGTAGPGTTGNGKVSIADVVKTTPRATQPEWGFKVVNKKKKGRA